MAASYTKLRSGEWGIRVQGEEVYPGRVVTVVRKDGRTKTEIVGKVLWEGKGVAICTINRPFEGIRRQRRRADCDCDCNYCSFGCKCDRMCVCKGGDIYDCC